jgi:hypothetical protein
LDAAIFLYATKLQLNMLFLSKIFRSIVKNRNRDDPLAPSSPTDIKMEQFLQKSGFTNTDIFEKDILVFLQILQKITSKNLDCNLPFLEKFNFASFQNGGFAQNGHKNSVF